MRPVFWKVEVSNDSVLLGLIPDHRQDYIDDLKSEGTMVFVKTFMVRSCSSPAAIRKAMLEYLSERGQELRLGQGTLYLSVTRSHKKEMKVWQVNGYKLIV